MPHAFGASPHGVDEVLGLADPAAEDERVRVQLEPRPVAGLVEVDVVAERRQGSSGASDLRVVAARGRHLDRRHRRRDRL